MPSFHKIALGLALILVSLAAPASDLAILRNGFSLRHERRQVLGPVTRLYLDTSGYVDVPSEQIERFERDESPLAAASPAPGQDLNQVVNSASDRQRLDPDLVHSVIRAESGFNTRAVSRQGALGLMQLMPQTATQLGVSHPFDPKANVEGGTRYLRELLERYNFDLIKALAAYNAGPRRIEQFRGVPPFHETRAYVARVIRDFNRQKRAEQNAPGSRSLARQKPRPSHPVPPSQTGQPVVLNQSASR